MRRKFSAEEIIARQLCILNEGRVIDFWHPRAQERWRDFMPEAQRIASAIRRGGFSITSRSVTAKATGSAA
jgi:hypothetical protein